MLGALAWNGLICREGRTFPLLCALGRRFSLLNCKTTSISRRSFGKKVLCGGLLTEFRVRSFFFFFYTRFLLLKRLELGIYGFEPNDLPTYLPTYRPIRFVTLPETETLTPFTTAKTTIILE